MTVNIHRSACLSVDKLVCYCLSRFTRLFDRYLRAFKLAYGIKEIPAINLLVEESFV